jgi:polar amino acid transport system substrate-binding protein
MKASAGFRLFSALALFLALPGLSAQSKLVMVTEEWPPFRIVDHGTASGFAGIDVDLAEKLENAIGLPIEIQRRPWARALEMMKSGEADLITGIAHSEERAAYILYVPTPYWSVVPVFYAKKGKGAAVRSYADLAGKSVGYSLSSKYFEPFNSDGSLKKVGLSTEVQILKMLSLGRIDLAIGTNPNIEWDISRLGYKGLFEKVAYQPPDKTELFVGLSKASPAVALAGAVDDTIRRMLADGTVKAIIDKYR